MPLINVNGIRQYYRLDGKENCPVIVLSHSLGCDHTMWDAQSDALSPHFRVLRYDTRGHGATDAPVGEYTLDGLAADALALLDALGMQQVIWCGLSMGGMIGQLIAAKSVQRFSRLILANTSPKVDSAAMDTRRRTVLEKGMAEIVDAVMGRFFMPSTIASGNPAAAGTRRVFLATNPAGYAGCCAAIRDMDNRPLLASIHTPTLIIGGDHDPSTPWAGHGDILARDIPNAKVIMLPTAHLSNIEQPGAFSAALSDFLKGHLG